MNKSVLIVTPFFAPQTHAAVFRAYKLAKYLPRYGWKPYVLTVDTNYHYNEDPSLLDELPLGVEVATARYIEPTLRGARMALGGRDRSFPAMKQQVSAGIGPASVAAPSLRDIGQRAYHHVLETWLQTPDPYWTWYRPALQEARRLIAEHDIPIVYTTCLPYTCNHIGLTLQRDGLKWVADFREPPPTYLARMSSRNERVFARQRSIERKTVRHANAITTTASASEMVFRDMYGDDVRAPIHFIPTGVDDDYLQGLEPANLGYPYLIFAGEYLREYGSDFFDVFACALRNEQMRALGVKLIVVGREEINRSRLQPILSETGTATSVVFKDHVPQRELYSLMKGARAGLLIPGRTAHWWNLFAKMIDYIALRIPTLAVVPDPSEARTQLTRAGLGVFLDGEQCTATQKLVTFLTGGSLSPEPIAAECDRFLVTNQTESFVDVFESLFS